jgi:protein O-GlcNAc transferase
MFDVWMGLLKALEESVLWLLDSNPAVERNLRHEAERRGVAPSRLIFA